MTDIEPRASSEHRSRANSSEERRDKYSLEDIQTESRYFIEDGEEPELILLKDSRHKNLFLAKVGLTFMIHFLAWVLITLLITNYNHLARDYFMLYRLLYSTWLYFFYAVVIRLIFAFAGTSVRNISKLFFIFDFYVTMVLILGLYYYYNNFLMTQYIWQGHYIYMLAYIMFFNMLAFTLSALITDKKRGYNYFAGFMMMEITCVLGVVIFYNIMDIPTITQTKQIYLLLILTIFNAIFATNAYYILKYRGKEFYEHEYIHCYFCIWTDWLFKYWRDLTHNHRSRKAKMIEEAKAKKRKRLEEERKRKKSLSVSESDDEEEGQDGVIGKSDDEKIEEGHKSF